MTYKNFQDCINKYRGALLNIISDFYREERIVSFPDICLEDRKTYFRSTEILEVKIKERKSTPLKYPEDAPKRKEELYLLKEDLKQNEVWIVKCSDFIKEMEGILEVFDAVEKEAHVPPFRFKFCPKEYKFAENGLLKGANSDMALSVFSSFVAFLGMLRGKENEERETAEIVIYRMSKQEKKYLQEYGDRIKNLKTKRRKDHGAGKLSKGKSPRIPREKFHETLKEISKYCESENMVGGQKVKYALKILKKKYGEQHNTEFSSGYLKNLFSKIKNRKI